ncbi:hypothetical protein TELCIR_14974 [Teladorsagia circumcincta]|uniref:Uncharacterized protein n=1 Tax=Teladorsagia circumcincta TaxID=45464 RepID=A0A2G9TZP9_TELCI|nr:hypothetical protein TELCIR_14974 [Teladorsagia circumcincta]
MHTTVLPKDKGPSKEPEGKSQSTKGPIIEAAEPTSFKRPQIRGDRSSTDHTTKATEAPDDPQKSGRPAKPENDDSSPKKRPNKTEKHPDDTEKHSDDTDEPKNDNSPTTHSPAIPIKNPDSHKKPRKDDNPTAKSTDASRHTGPSYDNHHPPPSRTTTTRRHVDREGPKEEPAKHTTERPRHTGDRGEPEKIHHSTTVENPSVNPHAVPSVEPEKGHHTTPVERTTERTRHTGGPDGGHHSTRKNTSVYRSTSGSEEPKDEDTSTIKGFTQPARPTSGPKSPDNAHHSTKEDTTITGHTGDSEGPTKEDQTIAESSTERTRHTYASEGTENGHYSTGKHPTTEDEPSDGSESPEEHTTEPVKPVDGSGEPSDHTFTTTEKSKHPGGNPDEPRISEPSVSGISTASSPGGGSEPSGNPDEPRVTLTRLELAILQQQKTLRRILRQRSIQTAPNGPDREMTYQRGRLLIRLDPRKTLQYPPEVVHWLKITPKVGKPRVRTSPENITMSQGPPKIP